MPKPKTNNKNGSSKNGQKSLRFWHRWVGYIAFVFVLILSLTGLILNRTEKLDLNQITIQNEFVAVLYGQSPDSPPVHFKAGDHWLSWLEGRLYLDGEVIAQNTPRPLGVTDRAEFTLIVSTNQLSLYLTDGSLVETLDQTSLPGPITALGTSLSGALIFESGGEKFTPDDSFTTWTPVSDTHRFTPSLPSQTPDAITEEILTDFRGQGISLYRLILDLHSGRILGSFGPYLMDLAAISLIFLGITGLMKRKRNGKDRRRKK